MAYVPDEWAIRRRDMSPTTRDLLIYYCMRANQATGQTNVSVQKTSQDLELRKDHVDEHDRKLARGGYIEIRKDENGGRVVQLCGPWQSSEQRKRKPSQVVPITTASQDSGNSTQDLEMPPQDLGTPLNSSPSFGQNPQNLGESTQNLGESTQNLGAHVRNNQPMNQPMEPAAEEDPAAAAMRQAIDAMTELAMAQYTVNGITHRSTEARILEEVGKLNGMGCTPDRLREFFRQRGKIPSLNYLATDWQAWAVNLSRTANGAASGVSAHLGRDGKPMLINPDTLTSKTRRNAFVIQDWIEEGGSK